MKYLVSGQEAQCAFSNLAENKSSTDEEEKEIIKIICVLYNKKKLNSVNDARFQFFCDKHKKRDDSQSIVKFNS